MNNKSGLNKKGQFIFKAELRIKPLPAGAEQYARQYFINLMLTGYIIVSPDGAIMSKDNIKQAMETWG